eukprot:5093176-Alexandrium_andersonii.AAC.1
MLHAPTQVPSTYAPRKEKSSCSPNDNDCSTTTMNAHCRAHAAHTGAEHCCRARRRQFRAC